MERGENNGTGNVGTDQRGACPGAGDGEARRPAAVFPGPPGGADHGAEALRALHAKEAPGQGTAAAERLSCRGSVRKLRLQADLGGKAHPAAGYGAAAVPGGAAQSGGAAGGADPVRHGAAACPLPPGRGPAGGIQERDVQPVGRQ